MLLNIRTLFFSDDILIRYKATEMSSKVGQKVLWLFPHVGFLSAYKGTVSYIQGVARNNQRLFVFVQFMLV
jgi:hypothetical protein